MEEKRSGGSALPSSPRRGVTSQDDGSGSYNSPPVVYEFSDTHKPHSPMGSPHAVTHLPTGSAVNEHARPMSPNDDGTGSYGAPPMGADDSHKAHRQ
ncbi:G-coupled receptor 64 isoform X1 [Micractinium conductrix]|uniref:G-coupled receptor 64 isoform X1 n=1 Tax=Micractinium conductrix TaxID=554055 RepID=A0A2P6VE54_9CHLO|nr:G-coupled receptor 64 isoform X1 [Micractinium conductrix]|eukprot:PSC72374.1 G-coupled receptor 64 isoform X1 [Micractinium conductrix]